LGITTRVIIQTGEHENEEKEICAPYETSTEKKNGIIIPFFINLVLKIYLYLSYNTFKIIPTIIYKSL